MHTLELPSQDLNQSEHSDTGPTGARDLMMPTPADLQDVDWDSATLR